MHESIIPAIVYIPPMIAHMLMTNAIKFLWFLVTFSVMGENSKLNMSIVFISPASFLTSKFDTN